MVRSGLLCFDEEKRCVFANLAASEILGLSPEELIGKSREEVLELQGRREAGQPADAGRKDSAEISFDLSFDNKPNGAAAPAITLLAGLDPESGRLVRDSRESMLLFRQVEKVRMEWE
ncbi:MAG: PAS domain-containing protein, partial [Nitrospiraceae bacterium]|nr:PAS domain-containing protein [Nitrospiraceae bacterium]